MATPCPLLPTCNIVTPIGMLGYGLDESITASLLAAVIPNGSPTALILDSGSTDSGPEKLALGQMTSPRTSYVRDLRKLIRLAWRFKVPLVFSSAGGDGSDEHVEEMVNVLKEICDEEGNEHYKLKLIAIYSAVTKTFVHERLKKHAISGCGSQVPPLTAELIDSAPRIASQMGPEPFYDAMMATPDFNVIVGGRAYDPSPYIAFAAWASKTSLNDTATPEAKSLWGGFTHMGKILECGGLCATPKCSAVRATVYQDGTFDLTPGEPQSRCTPVSVSAHTLYEKSRPDLLYGPGGWLDLTKSSYESLDDGRTCRVRGGCFTFSRDAGQKYTVKLEAARVVGYRSNYMGSVKDPILISQLDSVLKAIKTYVAQQHEGVDGQWDLDWHVYGQHQTTADGRPAEVFLIGEALASTQELARSIASTARIATVHAPYPNQKATSGNLAYGLGGKMESDLGPCAQFSIYHLVQLEEGEERLKLGTDSNALYRQELTVIGRGHSQPAISDPPYSKKEEHGQTPPLLETSIGGAHYPTSPKTLGDIARVLRSKNAGPYEITFDVMFATQPVFQLVKSSGCLNAAVIAGLNGISKDQVIWSGFFDQALAYKATIPRLWRGNPTPNGGFMESDVHGSQRYIGLLNLPLSKAFLVEWSDLVAKRRVDSGV
ncbi:uncharacterized protein CC84DRAFT_1205449 [Paraphaeosphaeria sporulosa]|uniref:DUF1446-domain-containing protein n=1 Tax=Paraphaeosphaeria sporulosa TaxID=1460663 RepID=A0A177CES4_9PLEO|nr:uncharacterized protein CC84DRAFT_1205449 [Paraphaeosphaeria sporulosa]OAG05721.1 hypothetical protein CC84DRAFT_1205449 [Paraphaeosphaeria sporulosa]